jgi:hypothetical protein
MLRPPSNLYPSTRGSELDGIGSSAIQSLDHAPSHRAPVRRVIQRAEALEDRMKSEGVIVLRAYLDSETFADWCTVRGLNPDREGRLAFGEEFAAEQYGRDQS